MTYVLYLKNNNNPHSTQNIFSRLLVQFCLNVILVIVGQVCILLFCDVIVNVSCISQFFFSSHFGNCLIKDFQEFGNEQYGRFQMNLKNRESIKIK